jgi:hypothetical protein
MPPNSSAIRVEIERTNLTEHGQRYRVTYAGKILAEGRPNPIFDACRALLARGITGRLEMWRRDKTSADMQLDIERGALFAIRETTTLSLGLVPWHPWWRTDDVDSNAVLYGGVQPPAVVCDAPSGGDTHQRKRPPMTPPRNETSLSCVFRC